MEKAADRLVASIGAEFPPGLSVNLQVRQGRPATEILNCARTIHAGLIAVGHQGTGGVRELLLGSVSAVIARYAPCSVLIARADPFAEAGRQPALHHLLLVVDDLPVVRQVIGMVHQLIPAGVQRLTLLHVQAPLNVNYLYGPFVSSNPSWQLNQSLHEAQKEAGEHRLQQVKKAIALPNLDIQTLLQIGDAGSLICQVAQEQQVDLVVLSGKAARQSLLAPLQGLRRQRQQNEKTGDRRILRNTRLGPTGDYVIHHAPCPVLLCRTEEKARS
jgi:nucleotide-binding universal stress UspA family protein